jgi:CheY-like chemotaxis protein
LPKASEIKKRTFSLTPSSPTADKHNIAKSPSHPEELFILLAEDNMIQRAIITRRLQKSAKAHHVKINLVIQKTFSGIKQVIQEHYEKYGKPFDAILTDNQMEDDKGKLQDNVGIQIINWLKENPLLQPPIRHMYSADEVKKEATESYGVHTFFNKTESQAAAEKLIQKMAMMLDTANSNEDSVIKAPNRSATFACSSP